MKREYKLFRNMRKLGTMWYTGFTGGKVCRCPSYDRNGKLNHQHTCSNCKLCFGAMNGKTYGLEIHCYEH